MDRSLHTLIFLATVDTVPSKKRGGQQHQAAQKNTASAIQVLMNKLNESTCFHIHVTAMRKSNGVFAIIHKRRAGALGNGGVCHGQTGTFRLRCLDLLDRIVRFGRLDTT